VTLFSNPAVGLAALGVGYGLYAARAKAAVDATASAHKAEDRAKAKADALALEQQQIAEALAAGQAAASLKKAEDDKATEEANARALAAANVEMEARSAKIKAHNDKLAAMEAIEAANEAKARKKEAAAVVPATTGDEDENVLRGDARYAAYFARLRCASPNHTASCVPEQRHGGRAIFGLMPNAVAKNVRLLAVLPLHAPCAPG
jgi:hypothetical protein